MLQLRLTIFEDGHQDRSFVYRLSREEVVLASKHRANLGAFDSPRIREMLHRDGQRDLIESAVKMLGRQAVNFRDDRDGWNGERRAEIISNATRL